MTLAPSYKGTDPYVFVSYSHGDAADVTDDIAWFQQQGINIWYDEGIEAGSEWREEIARALKSATLVLFYVSGKSVLSENCRKEINLADSSKVPILSVHLEETELPHGLDLTLSDRQAVFRYGQSLGEYRERILKRFADFMGAIEPGSAANSSPEPVAKNESRSTRRRNRLVIIAPALVLLIAVSAYIGLRLLPDLLTPVEMSVAVLPFENTNNDPALDAFVAGFSEQVVTEMSQINPCVNGGDCGFRTIARQRSFNLPKDTPLAKVRDELDANFAVSGSVSESKGDIRVYAEVSRAKDGHLIWSSTYSGDSADTQKLIDQSALHLAHMGSAMVMFDRGVQLLETLQPFNRVGMFEHFTVQMMGFNEFLKIRTGEDGDWRVLESLMHKVIEADPENIGPYLVSCPVNNLTFRGHKMFPCKAPSAVNIENIHKGGNAARGHFVTTHKGASRKASDVVASLGNILDKRSEPRLARNLAGHAEWQVIYGTRH